MGAIAPESSQVRPGFAGKVRYRKLKSNPLAGSHTPRGQGARKRRVWESLAVRSSTSFEMLFLRRNPGRRDAVIGYVLIHLCYLKALDGVLAWSQARIIRPLCPLHLGTTSFGDHSHIITASVANLLLACHPQGQSTQDFAVAAQRVCLNEM